MPNPAHEIPDTHVVTSIYQSCPEPAMNEEGFEVQVATLPSGATHSLVLLDHTDGNMIEMPPEVAVAISWVITTKLIYAAEDVRLVTPAPIEDDLGNEWQVISIYRSQENPAMGEAGYDLHAAVCAEGLVQAITLYDHVAADRVDMPPHIARSVALAMTAFPLFPTSAVN